MVNIKKVIFYIVIVIFMSFINPVFSYRFVPLVITSENIGQFDRLLKTLRESSCVIVQVFADELDSRKVKILLNWVERGGTLWFYDSRLAHFFSMKPCPFKNFDYPCKELEGEYGVQKKYPGIAVGCEAWGNHALTFGIRRVLIFALKVDEDSYSAILDEEGVIPLLKISRNDKFSFAAIKNIGEGSVIFKPLLWKDKFDGGDFQERLIKYSSRKAVLFLE